MGGSGSGGRNAKPTALKKLQGNPGKRPLNTVEPIAPDGEPELPRGMSKAANREWAFIVPQLRLLGVLSIIDGKALAQYCDAHAHVEMARKEIKKHGLLIEEAVTSKEGFYVGTKYKENPAVNIYAKFSKIMNTYLQQFGLTPSSRSKLKIEKPKPVDEMETFMQGGVVTTPTQDAFEDLDEKDLVVN